MGLNDGFVDKVQCPSCGEAVIMRLQIKIDGVDMNDYSPGDSVGPDVLAAVRRNEAEFIGALASDLGAKAEDIADIDLESEDGTFGVVGIAYRVGRQCSCGQAPEKASRVAVVTKGVFQGLAEELPDQGPVVTDRGAVFPRWMLHDPDLRSHIVGALESFFGSS